jgi:putative addiction module killer protein
MNDHCIDVTYNIQIYGSHLMDVRYQVHSYRTEGGLFPFHDWLRASIDRVGRSRIRARLKLLEFGHLGDWKPIGHGAFELRIHTGPGYRIYCGRAKNTFVILWGGDKGTQTKDISRATGYWTDYLRRTK